MTVTMTEFLVAVGATSAVCYALMTRVQNCRANRRSHGYSASDSGGYEGGDGFSVANWFGDHHSALDGAGNPIDAGGSDGGGGDSAGGGDGGGGDGGGGGD